MVQLPSNLRDNWSRNEQNETSGALRSGVYVSSLGPTSPTPVHNAASTNVGDETASRAAGVRLKKVRGSRLCCVMNRTDGRTDGHFFSFQRSKTSKEFWPSETSREPRVLVKG